MNVWKRTARVGLSAATIAALATGTSQIVSAQTAAAKYGDVTATTAVNVRSGPSATTAIMGVLYRGDKAHQVGDTKNGFVPVTFAGHTGYVSAQYVSGEQATSDGGSSKTSGAGTVYATTAVHVRSGASLSASVVATLATGEAVTRTGVSSGPWTQVTYRGATRWVYSTYLTTTKPGGSSSVKITGRARATTALMIRTTSGSDFTSLGDIPTGTIVDLTGVTAPGVAQILYNGALRWVNSKYLTPVSSTNSETGNPAPKTVGTRYATADLDIRTTPAAVTTVVGEAASGSTLQITGTVSGGYAQIVWNGTARWVTAKYLSTTPTLNTGGSVGLDGLKPNGKLVVAYVRAHFKQITTMYGVRPDPDPDHPSGHAVDLMLPDYKNNQALGWTIANTLRANAKSLGIQYIIFDQHIWNIQRDSEGWRLMADRGSDTANHINHVHVTVY